MVLELCSVSAVSASRGQRTKLSCLSAHWSGQYVAVGASTGAVLVFATEDKAHPLTFVKLFPTLSKGSQSAVTVLAFAGDLLAVGNADGVIVVVDTKLSKGIAETHRIIGTVKRKDTTPITALHWGQRVTRINHYISCYYYSVIHSLIYCYCYCRD
jgi:WD40 repeat protein